MLVFLLKACRALIETYRWVFWSSSIVDAVIQVAGVFCLQETYAPVLLEWKAARVRKEDEEKGRVRSIRTVFEGKDRK